MKKLPLQPIIKDAQGVDRFQANEIVRYLLDNGGIDLNDLTRKGFDNEHWEQFAQLIGYSVSGFSELSYVSDETYSAAASLIAKTELTEEQARIEYLENCLSVTREGLKEIVPALFKIHPDDLEV